VVGAGALALSACSKSNAHPKGMPSVSPSASASPIASASVIVPRKPPPAFATSDEAAEHGLKLFRQLAKVRPERVGLKGPHEIADTELKPASFEIRWLHGKDISKPGPFTPMRLVPALDDKQQRLYPVSVKGEIRACILVEKRSAGWQPVTYGDPVLAEGLKRALTLVAHLPGYDSSHPASDLIFNPEMSVYFVVDGKLAPNKPLPQLVPTRNIGGTDGQNMDAKTQLTLLRNEILRGSGKPNPGKPQGD